MKVLRVRPKHYPEVIDIDCSLESLQKEVEGPIQAVYPWDDEVALICNEEGKLYDDCMEKLNRTLDGPYGIPIDIIVGTFLIVGLTEDDFGELFGIVRDRRNIGEHLLQILLHKTPVGIFLDFDQVRHVEDFVDPGKAHTRLFAHLHLMHHRVHSLT